MSLNAFSQRPFANPPHIRSFSYTSPVGSSGVDFVGGFYEAPAADTDRTQAAPTQTLGSANNSYAAHAFAVFSGAGSASGGTGTVEIEVSGTSITDAGVRTESDTEVITTDITATSTDEYIETSKKWIGQVTYTLQVSGAGDHTTFASTFNYGFAKYDDFGNRDFTITDFEAVGIAGNTDANPNIELLEHTTTGWTYSAAAFVAGTTPLADMSSDHGTEGQFVSGQPFAYKRSNLTTKILGADSEGFLIRITGTANKSIEDVDFHVGVTF